jgi:hypothetical protein
MSLPFKKRILVTPSAAFSHKSISQHLEELIDFKADVTLEFQDGTMSANSTLLGLYSSVLRGATEVATAGTAGCGTSAGSNRSRDSSNITIPMPSTKKDEWMQVAPFLYPVVPPPTINNWTQLETLLKVSSTFDIQLVLHKAEQYLISSISELDAEPTSEKSVWKWLNLADKAGLQECLAVLATRAAAIDRAGCAQLEGLQGLSPPALKQLVVACAQQPGLPRVGELKNMQCSHRCQYTGVETSHTLSWRCNHCRR